MSSAPSPSAATDPEERHRGSRRNQLQPVASVSTASTVKPCFFQMRAQQAEEPTVVFDRKIHACAIGPDDQRTAVWAIPAYRIVRHLNIVSPSLLFRRARLVPPRAASSCCICEADRRSVTPRRTLTGDPLIVFARPELRTLAAGLGCLFHRREAPMICDVHAHYHAEEFQQFMGDRFASPVHLPVKRGMARPPNPFSIHGGHRRSVQMMDEAGSRSRYCRRTIRPICRTRRRASKPSRC